MNSLFDPKHEAYICEHIADRALRSIARRTAWFASYYLPHDGEEVEPGYGAIAIRKPDGVPVAGWFRAGDTATIVKIATRAALQQAAGYGIHITMATRSEKLDKFHTGSHSALQAMRALWVDIDDATPDTAYELLLGPLPPSLVVWSGRGIHAYWRLLRPVMAQDPQVGRILRGLAEHHGGDIQATDPTRLMRAAGSINTKPDYGKNGYQTTMIRTSARYLLREFQSLESAPEVKPILRPRVPLAEGEHVSFTAQQIADMCLNAQNKGGYFLASCPTPKHQHGDRHPGLSIKQADDRVLLNCHAGCTAEEIVAALNIPMGSLFSGNSRPARGLEIRAMARELRQAKMTNPDGSSL